MSVYRVRKGALDPVGLQVTITPSDAVPDLSDVTAAEIVSTDTATQVESTWSVEITSQSETSLVILHRYETADTATLRDLQQHARLTVTGAANPVLTPSWTLRVVAR